MPVDSSKNAELMKSDYYRYKVVRLEEGTKWIKVLAKLSAILVPSTAVLMRYIEFLLG